MQPNLVEMFRYFAVTVFALSCGCANKPNSEGEAGVALKLSSQKSEFQADQPNPPRIPLKLILDPSADKRWSCPVPKIQVRADGLGSGEHKIIDVGWPDLSKALSSSALPTLEVGGGAFLTQLAERNQKGDRLTVRANLRCGEKESPVVSNSVELRVFVPEG